MKEEARTRPKQTFDSLPSEEVGLLLRTLRFHVHTLTASHEDAFRRNYSGHSPCYLLDYQLLHMYMYEGEAGIETVVELEYLLGREDIIFLLGRGTMVELIYRLSRLLGQRAGGLVGLESVSGADELMMLNVSWLEDQLGSLLEKQPEHILAIARLASILRRTNVRTIGEDWELEATDESQQAFGAAFSVLEVRRPGLFYSNLADSLNIADVVALRGAALASRYRYFPFHLTETTALLEERGLVRNDPLRSHGLEPVISRRPTTAVYSQVVFQLQSNAEEAVDYTSDLISKAEEAAARLRRSRGYKEVIPSWDESQWEELITRKTPRHPLIDNLAALSEFIDDPVVLETQRILDNTQLVQANVRALRRQLTEVESPRRVFDLVVAVSHFLASDDRVGKVLAPIWPQVVSRQAHEWDERTTVVEFYRHGEARPTLVVETHLPPEGDRFQVVRWPIKLTIEEVVNTFNWAFGRHYDDGLIGLFVGSDQGVEAFDTMLPLSLGEILDAVSPPVYWLRLAGGEFDLYAEIAADPEVEPIMSIMGEKLSPFHVADLYAATSARHLFRSWIVPMLTGAGLS